MVQPDLNPREYVTYEKMVGYVDGRLVPIQVHVAAHDRWHLAQIQTEQDRDDARDNAIKAARRQNVANLIAAVAVIAAMLAVLVSHIWG